MGASITDSVWVQATRLARQAREDGRAAYYGRRGLEYCPHVAPEQFYQASMWRIGWQDAEREAAGGWLASLVNPATVELPGASYRFGAGAPDYADEVN